MILTFKYSKGHMLAQQSCSALSAYLYVKMPQASCAGLACRSACALSSESPHVAWLSQCLPPATVSCPPQCLPPVAVSCASVYSSVLLARPHCY